MTKNLKFLFSIVAIALSACMNSNSKLSTMHESDFQTIVKLRESRVKTNEVLNIRQLIALDSLLLINNSRNDSVFMVLNLNTSKIIKSWGDRGRGPEEYGAWTHLLNVSDEIFQIADFTKNRIETYKISDLNLTNSREIIKNNDIRKLEIPQRISSLDSNHFFYDNFSEDKLSIKQMTIGEIPTEINQFDHMKDLFPTPWYYTGTLTLNKNEQKIVYAYRYLRRFDIMNFEGELIKTVKMTPAPNLQSNIEKDIDLEKSIMCYMGAKDNKSSFFLLYLGYSAEELMLNDYNLSCFIEEYDWDGNPIKRYEINRYISDFAIITNKAQTPSFIGIDVIDENPIIVFNEESHK